MRGLPHNACVVLFAKPAVAGEVKTRLIGDLTAEQAAELHAAFVEDLTERLQRGDFDLWLAWAIADDQPLPVGRVPAMRQRGGELGSRLFAALEQLAGQYALVAAIGSDHPEIPVSRLEEAFDKLRGRADVVIGPAADGGYYLIATRSGVLEREMFRDIPWSSERVLSVTLERCRGLGLEVALLAPGCDVDTAADLVRLTQSLAADPVLECPRTRRLLKRWNRL